MQPSKIFILSLIYPKGLKAINFIDISTINIQVNILFNIYSKSNVSYSSNNPSKANTIVLQRTANVKKFSTIFPLTKYYNFLWSTIRIPIIP